MEKIKTENEAGSGTGVPPVSCWLAQALKHTGNFADCIRTDRKSEVNDEMGRRDMQIIPAVYESAATGKRVVV